MQLSKNDELFVTISQKRRTVRVVDVVAPPALFIVDGLDPDAVQRIARSSSIREVAIVTYLNNLRRTTGLLCHHKDGSWTNSFGEDVSIHHVVAA